MAEQKFPWRKIKTEYINTNISMRKLAVKYGVSYNTLNRRAREEKWTTARKARDDYALKIATQKSAEMQAEQLAQIGALAGAIVDRIVAEIADEEQFHRYIITDGIGGGATETTERRFDKVDSKAIRDLTSTLKDALGIIRNAYGIPTQAEAEAQRIAAERLELDRKRAASEDAGDKTIQVVIGKEAEEWAQ